MGRALLLNASLEPLCVVPMRRAVVLVLKEKAEVLARNGAVLHSERAEFPVPSVIRLNSYVRVPYRSRLPLSRRTVFARDGHRCQYCDRTAENIDHVVPRSRGGRHTWDNVVAACRACNSQKEDRLLSEVSLRLRRVPREPAGDLWLVATAGTIDPAWVQFLPTHSPARAASLSPLP